MSTQDDEVTQTVTEAALSKMPKGWGAIILLYRESSTPGADDGYMAATFKGIPQKDASRLLTEAAEMTAERVDEGDIEVIRPPDDSKH